MRVASKRAIEMEPVFRVNRETKATHRWDPEGLETLGLLERRDLQQWFVEELKDTTSGQPLGILESVIGSPVVGEGHSLGGRLLLISEEFSGWIHGSNRQQDRLDLLLLDTQGAPVVVELKRGVAEETADLQALKYAAFVSTLQVADIEQMLAGRLETDEDAARAMIADHVEGASSQSPLEGLEDVRVVLIAEGFTAPTTTTAMFLRERGIDLRCVELAVRRLTDAEVAVSPRLLVPPPAAESFLVRRQQQEKAEAKSRETKRRRARTVDILLAREAIPPGTALRFAANLLGPERRPVVEAWIAELPARGLATWTGEPGSRALKWQADEQHYTATELARNILNAALGTELDAVPGPDYWLAPGSETEVLSVLADRLLADST